MICQYIFDRQKGDVILGQGYPSDDKVQGQGEDQSSESVVQNEEERNFECVCGSSGLQKDTKWSNNLRHQVQCVVCEVWSHAECLNYDFMDLYRGQYKCPQCHTKSVSSFTSQSNYIILNLKNS